MMHKKDNDHITLALFAMMLIVPLAIVLVLSAMREKPVANANAHEVIETETAEQDNHPVPAIVMDQLDLSCFPICKEVDNVRESIASLQFGSVCW